MQWDRVLTFWYWYESINIWQTKKEETTWQISKWKHIISCCNRFWDFSGAAVILVMWFSPLSTVYGFGKRSIARGIQEKAQQSPKPCFGFAGPSWACVASCSVYGESSRSGIIEFFPFKFCHCMTVSFDTEEVDCKHWCLRKITRSLENFARVSKRGTSRHTYLPDHTKNLNLIGSSKVLPRSEPQYSRLAFTQSRSFLLECSKGISTYICRAAYTYIKRNE